jgi:hypothetical protein
VSESDDETPAQQLVPADEPKDPDEPEEGVTYYSTLDELFYELSNGAVGTKPRPLSERRYEDLLRKRGVEVEEDVEGEGEEDATPAAEERESE